MSSPGFDDVLKRKINEQDLEYNPALWERLSQRLPEALSQEEFDNKLRQRMNDGILAFPPVLWEQLAAQLPLTLGTAEFDKHIKQKADNYHLNYPPESWLRFAAKLPFPVIQFPSRRRTLKRVSGIAALFLLALTATVFLMNKKQQSAMPADQHYLAKRQAGHSMPPTMHTDTALTKGNAPANTVAYRKTNSNTSVASSIKPFSYSNVKPLVSRADAIFNSIPQDNTSLKLIQKQAISLQDASGSNIRNNNNVNNSTAFNDAHTPRPTPEMYYPDSYYPEQNKKLYYHKTSLALNGGANYGTFRQGVTVGFSARHFVNDKVFIDGAIAMMINHGDDNTLNYTGDVMKDVFSHNTGSGRAARPSGTYYNVNNFYYIQFNPSVGTKLNKRFMVSTGPDFQQLLTSSPDPTIMFKDHDVKLVPNFDVGLTGKAEFFISSSIQTGILYRQGVNNIIRNNNDYLNRNYFQVELKYTLPLSIAQ